MVRRWLPFGIMLAALLIAGAGVDQAIAQNNVTFKVNLAVQILKGNFNPATDSVSIAGDVINNWNATADILTKGASDSIYSITKSLPTGTAKYKFTSIKGGSASWENDPNRTYTVVAGDQTVPTAWFNRDSVIAGKVAVTFSVNMAVKMQEGTFLPDSGDIVRAAGSFNSWGGTGGQSADTLTKGASDSVYSKTIQVDGGAAIQYKFLKTSRGGLDWEQDAPTGPGNRTFTPPMSGSASIPASWFNNDSVVNTAVTTDIDWSVNMDTYQQLGWFDPVTDTMQVRGGFEGWGGTKIFQDLFDPNKYALNRQYIGTSGDLLSYKFYIKIDTATALSRWGSDWLTHQDDYNYEHPAEGGDGNNSYTVVLGANQGPVFALYSGIHPRGIFSATDSTNVTFTVNMGPAKRYSNPFVPATDTAKVVFYNRMWLASQWLSHGGAANFPQAVVMTLAPGGGDSIYTATMKIKGPTHYNILYYYRVNKSDLTSYDEGGGLGAAYPYRSRFIRNGERGAWGSEYSFPQDSWQKNPPMPVETALFPTGVNQQPDVPLVYQLNQNYPNPFNPTTQITYTLPIASTVSLKVYNVLGQVVATLAQGTQPKGNYTVLFEGKRLASGVYFYRLEAGSFTQARKMLLLK